jgi:hypothetical protein
MAKFGTKLSHIVILVIFAIGVLYTFHMVTNHQGSKILPSLGLGK